MLKSYFLLVMFQINGRFKRSHIFSCAHLRKQWGGKGLRAVLVDSQWRRFIEESDFVFLAIKGVMMYKWGVLYSVQYVNYFFLKKSVSIIREKIENRRKAQSHLAFNLPIAIDTKFKNLHIGVTNFTFYNV